jgi:Glu-tRNA(Gln) amidotransferase subunit E-like FAD-binding protein
MKEKVETVEDVRKRELKRIDKRLKELLEFKNGKNEDGTNNYDSYDAYRALPDIARTAIKNEIDALQIKRRQLQFDADTMKDDFRAAFMNVLKYYGVDDKLPEIEERFNRYKENKRLESVISELADAASYSVTWKAMRKDYLY